MIGKKLIVLMLPVLFIGAMYSISNVTNANLQENIASSSWNISELQQKQVQLQKKKLGNVNAETESRTIEHLEDVVDVTKYPAVNVVATGYTAGPESTGKTAEHPEYGITYSGLEVKRDLYSTIAADLNVFPLGTIIYVPDYGYGVVADIGGAIKGNKIDLFFNTVEDVYSEWGKKELDVYVIEQGDGKITEAELLQLNETESLQVFREQFK